MPGRGRADTREVRIMTKFLPKALPAVRVFRPVRLRCLAALSDVSQPRSPSSVSDASPPKVKPLYLAEITPCPDKPKVAEKSSLESCCTSWREACPGSLLGTPGAPSRKEYQ